MVIPFIVGFTVIPLLLTPFSQSTHHVHPKSRAISITLARWARNRRMTSGSWARSWKSAWWRPHLWGAGGGTGRFPVRGRYAPFCSLFWDVLGNFHCIIVSPKKVEHSQILLQWWFREIYTCLHFVGEGIAHIREALTKKIAHIVGSLVISWLNNPI